MSIVQKRHFDKDKITSTRTPAKPEKKINERKENFQNTVDEFIFVGINFHGFQETSIFADI